MSIDREPRNPINTDAKKLRCTQLFGFVFVRHSERNIYAAVPFH